MDADERAVLFLLFGVGDEAPLTSKVWAAACPTSTARPTLIRQNLLLKQSPSPSIPGLSSLNDFWALFRCHVRGERLLM